MSIKDPRPALDKLGVADNQVTSTTYGYSGTYTPEVVFLHWTASGSSSDTASDVVHGKHYQCCLSRSGVACLGGWQVRQGHGGEGRTSPMNETRNGQMTAARIKHWQGDGSGDNTSSQPNQYGVGVCIDNNGVGEVPPDAQYVNFCKTVAAFLDAIGRTSNGYVMDHAASTNRKIDITASTPKLDPERWFADIGTYLTLLQEGPAPIMAKQAVAMTLTKTGKGYWILANDGGVFSYGDAHFSGSMYKEDGSGKLSESTPVDLVGDPDGSGYWILTADGGVFTFGSKFYGSAANDMNPPG